MLRIRRWHWAALAILAILVALSQTAHAEHGRVKPTPRADTNHANFQQVDETVWGGSRAVAECGTQSLPLYVIFAMWITEVIEGVRDTLWTMGGYLVTKFVLPGTPRSNHEDSTPSSKLVQEQTNSLDVFLDNVAEVCVAVVPISLRQSEVTTTVTYRLHLDVLPSVVDSGTSDAFVPFQVTSLGADSESTSTVHEIRSVADMERLRDIMGGLSYVSPPPLSLTDASGDWQSGHLEYQIDIIVRPEQEVQVNVDGKTVCTGSHLLIIQSDVEGNVAPQALGDGQDQPHDVPVVRILGEIVAKEADASILENPNVRFLIDQVRFFRGDYETRRPFYSLTVPLALIIFVPGTLWVIKSCCCITEPTSGSEESVEEAAAPDSPAPASRTTPSSSRSTPKRRNGCLSAPSDALNRAPDSLSTFFLDPRVVTIDKKRVLGQAGVFGGLSNAIVRPGILQHVGRTPIPVAVKCIFWPSEMNRKPDDMAPLPREALMSLIVNHQNVCWFYGCFADAASDTVRLVYELCDGGTVLEWLRGRAVQSPQTLDRDRMEMLLQAARGLQYLHCEKEMAHRDLKPANLMVKVDDETGSATLKIVDFGTAEFERMIIEKPGEQTLRMERGTIPYMPQRDELYNMLPLKHDIYSLAIVAWQLWSEKRPFYDAVERYGQWLQVSPRTTVCMDWKCHEWIHQCGLRPDLDECIGMPARLKELVARCWHQNPTERPAIDEVVAVLGQVHGSLWISMK